MNLFDKTHQAQPYSGLVRFFSAAAGKTETVGSKQRKQLTREFPSCPPDFHCARIFFGAMVLESFYALPWRGDHFEKGAFGLNFTPGW
jgi:hypothetical protein